MKPAEIGVFFRRVFGWQANTSLRADLALDALGIASRRASGWVTT